MAIELVRVIHKQVIKPGLSRSGSILLDKVDRTTGNSDSPPYAQNRKQKVYVPYSDPITSSFAGYTDLIETDEVLLAADHPKGVIAGLVARGHVDAVKFQSNLIATPVVTNAQAGVPGGSFTITGTTFASLLPTLTQVHVTSAGVTTIVTTFSSNSGTAIVVANATFTLVAGMTVRVFANNKFSNSFIAV